MSYIQYIYDHFPHHVGHRVPALPHAPALAVSLNGPFAFCIVGVLIPLLLQWLFYRVI